MIGSRLKIREVKIEVDEKRLKRVEIGGRTNIFDHDQVRKVLDERDGRIVQIQGEMKFKDQGFYFQCGYTDKFGKVQVTKKGQRNGNLMIVEEAFDFLEKLFMDHFVTE